MKVIFKILFLCMFSFQLNAQSYFNKLYDYNGGDSVGNHATSAIELSTGDFLIAGNKFLPDYSGLHYIKINSLGDTIFHKRYPKTNCAYFSSIGNSLIACYDGNLAQAAVYYDSTSNANALLVKLTPDGDTLWTKTFGGANFDNANSIQQTPDSGFVLMGVTQSFTMGAGDFYIIKTDKYGIIQWQQSYGTTVSEACVSGQITLDGGFIMSGHKANVLHIVKTDEMGGFQWQQTYPGTKNVGFITQLADSSYILTGAKNVSGLGDEACMLKLNKNGGVIWQKTFGATTSVNLDLFYTRPLVLNDHSLVIAGTTMLGSIPIGMLIKTDSAGNQQWLRTYYANPSFDNYIYDLKATSDGGFLLTGSGGIASQDAWVVKVDSNGCEIANCNVGINEFDTSSIELLVYPNPAYNQINVSVSGISFSEFEISIVNTLGQIQKTESNTSVINISNFSTGIYFISATSKDGKLRLTEKFIKE